MSGIRERASLARTPEHTARYPRTSAKEFVKRSAAQARSRGKDAIVVSPTRSMSRRKYPPLTPAEVKAILTRWSFAEKNREGSHAQFERLADHRDRQRRVVTVDLAEREFDEFLIKSMIRQSGLTREEFYGATKKTAKRASVAFVELPDTGVGND